MLALAALVWGLQPDRLKLQPAPLRPQEGACPKVRAEFIPTNFTDLPGVGLAALSKERRNHVLLRLNLEPCPCGCNTSIAFCLVNHPRCQQARELAQKTVAEESGGQ
jgi:hypothetical protein